MNDPQFRFDENNIIASFNSGEISKEEMNKKLSLLYSKYRQHGQLPARIQ